MTKKQLTNEIKKYIMIGCSTDAACMKVNNLYLNKYLSKIYEIQQEIKGAA